MTTTLKKTVPHHVEIKLDGSEVADLFWELDQDGQAEFFNQLGIRDRLSFQLQAVTDSKKLTSRGRLAMERISQYSDKN